MEDDVLILAIESSCDETAVGVTKNEDCIWLGGYHEFVGSGNDVATGLAKV